MFRAESLRKRLRAISESEDPLSFLRDSSCPGNVSADAGVEEWRQDGAGELCLENPTNPVSEENLPQDDCNLDQEKWEYHPAVAKGGDTDAELCQGNKGCDAMMTMKSEQDAAMAMKSSIIVRAAIQMGAHSS